MSVEQARAILGPEIVAEIEARHRTPLSPRQIARITPVLRAALDRSEPDAAASAA